MALTVHFLSVGHGDCTIVEFPSGRLMVADIDRASQGPGMHVQQVHRSSSLPHQAYKGRSIFSVYPDSP